MDIVNAVIEAVIISFFMGAILGGIVATHFARKHAAAEEQTHSVSSELEPVKIKVKDR